MKIGILTFHCAHNYGAVLQCYATQEFLRSKGYDVEIINYRPEYLLRPYKLFDKTRFKANNPIQFIKKIIIELMIFKMRYKRWKGFEKFINNRLSVGCVVTKNTLPSDCNAYIIGSDQVWNPRITRGFDSIYFANFPFEKEEKKYISYAASMETKSLDETQIEFYKKNMEIAQQNLESSLEKFSREIQESKEQCEAEYLSVLKELADQVQIKTEEVEKIIVKKYKS